MHVDRKTAFTILLVALTVSVVALTCSSGDRQVFGMPLGSAKPPDLFLSAPVALTAGLQEYRNPLNQATRLGIYTFVKDNPGVHFRGICSSLNLSVGVAQYHLSVLVHAGLVDASSDGQLKRYFEVDRFTKNEAQLISLLRHETKGRILSALAQGDSVLHRDLACSLKVSSQALSWQMKQLKTMVPIETARHGIHVEYSLSREAAAQLKPFLNVVSS